MLYNKYINIATNSQFGERHVLSIEAAASHIEAMPRARSLGGMALDLCHQADRKVMSAQDFVIAVRQAIVSIVRWAKDAPLSEEVIAFCEASDEELIEIQRRKHFSKVQLIQWTGEMKLQLFEARHTPPR